MKGAIAKATARLRSCVLLKKQKDMYRKTISYGSVRHK